jgi:abortive infection bacteriophage resistance protein
LPKPNDERYAHFLENVKDETAKSKEHFVTHFKKKYGDRHDFLPIWMATEVMNFGTVLTLYSGCSNQVKNAVATCIGVPAKVLTSWLLALNTVRNICAHHSRLWNRVLGVKPSIPKRNDYPDWHVPTTVPNDRVFVILTICRHSLKKIAPQSNWPERLRALLAEYPSIPLNEMGFPDAWESSPIWQQSNN